MKTEGEGELEIGGERKEGGRKREEKKKECTGEGF